MKYSAANKPLVCMMTNSTCYKRTGKMTVKGVLWHSTGANNPYLKRYVQPDDNAGNRANLLAKLGTNAYKNDWNHTYVEAGLNAWVGKLADGTVTSVQTMPWDYRPWGCGSGKKGSCNNNFVQFEICEDSLTDATYFNQAYKEACELTAYICQLYNIDPNGYSTVNGVKVPNILCHYDSYKLGLGSGHTDVYNWFNNFGKTMDHVRADVAALLKGGNVGSNTNVQPKSTSGTYLKNGSSGDEVKQLQEKLRKLGYDPGPIDGIFGGQTEAAVRKFQTAKGLVVDGAVGNQTSTALEKALLKKDETTASPATTSQPTTTTTYTPKVGDIVKVQGTNYYNGKEIPAMIKAETWIVHAVSGDRVVLNKSTSGKFEIMSPFYAKDLVPVQADKKAEPSVPAFQPYLVRVDTDALNIRAGAGTNYAVNGVIRDRSVYTIVEEKNGFGKLKSGAGWISLQYTKKV